MRVLVTGGTLGLGRAFCASLVAQGHDVTSLDVAVPDNRCGFTHIPCDLARRDSIDNALRQIVTGPPFDLVIFNAGISATGPFETISPEAHARVMAINAVAPMLVCASLLGRDAIAGGGRIAFVASLSHFTGYPGAASYGAAKDAVAVYARSLVKPLKKTRAISVTCAFPGPLKTDHAARHAPQGADADKRMTPERAAELILRDVMARRRSSLPGGAAKLFAAFGRTSPKLATAAMRRIIYDKLDRTVED